MANFDLDGYFRRIGFAGEAKPDLATLATLQAAHVAAIAFEALDPLLRRPVSLEVAEFQAKLVEGRRGGYCFEQNALFKAALESIGFAVVGLAGRPRWNAPPDSPLGPKTHMLLSVETPEGSRLAVVGYGANLVDVPLEFAVGREQSTPAGVLRLRESEGLHWLEARRDESWRTLYAFDLAPQRRADYALANWFTSTNPTPPFLNNLVLERLESGRRYKIVNRRTWTEGRDGVVEGERRIESGADLERSLEDVFGVTPRAPADEIFARAPE